MTLLDKQIHPTSDLQVRLGAGEHLRQQTKLNIDSPNTSLQTLYKIEGGAVFRVSGFWYKRFLV